MHTVALQADCHKIVIILLQNYLSVSGLKVCDESLYQEPRCSVSASGGSDLR